MQIDGRVALVTGGGRRVGRVLAEALAERGAIVAVHYNASSKGADDVVRGIESRGGRAAAFGSDLSDRDAPPHLIAAVAKQFGSLDILVNSAAVMLRTPWGGIEPAVWDSMFALNIRAPFFLAQAAAPHLSKTNGVIVNIADLAAFETWPDFIPHGISKGGVVHMTRALARILAPEVRVNAIAPGTVLMPDDAKPDVIERFNATTPLRRQGSPGDVAQAMLYLLEADYVTGETIIVDGGRHIRK